MENIMIMNDPIGEFLKALELTGTKVDASKIVVDDLGCPHTSKGLPHGKMAIYTFQRGNRYLKIGKAGPNSDARFRSQHYNPNRAKSNLAKSLLDDPDMAAFNLNEKNIEKWIKNNVRRIDILIEQDVGILVLNFLETFLHCKYRPKYEGFENQR
jgi:hypothetical protein